MIVSDHIFMWSSTVNKQSVFTSTADELYRVSPQKTEQLIFQDFALIKFFFLHLA